MRASRRLRAPQVPFERVNPTFGIVDSQWSRIELQVGDAAAGFTPGTEQRQSCLTSEFSEEI